MGKQHSAQNKKHKTLQNKNKKYDAAMAATKRMQIMSNNNHSNFAEKVKNNQRRQHSKVINNLNKSIDKDTNIGKEYVEKFCKLSKINQPKVTTKHMVKSKNLQEWQCVIQLGQIGVIQKANSKKKQQAVNICYQRLANRISKEQI